VSTATCFGTQLPPSGCHYNQTHNPTLQYIHHPIHSKKYNKIQITMSVNHYMFRHPAATFRLSLRPDTQPNTPIYPSPHSLKKIQYNTNHDECQPLHVSAPSCHLHAVTTTRNTTQHSNISITPFTQKNTIKYKSRWVSTATCFGTQLPPSGCHYNQTHNPTLQYIFRSFFYELLNPWNAKIHKVDKTDKLQYSDVAYYNV